MKERQSSAMPILDRAGAGFSLIGIWRENRTSLLLAVALVAAVVILFIWLARRRRQDAFPELRADAAAEARAEAYASAAASDMGMTQIEGQAEAVPRNPDLSSPGLHGKIEVVVHGQQISSYLITDHPLPVGRDPGQSLVVIPEPIVSKLHCQVFARGGRVFVRDLSSTNGIYVNEEKVSERELLDNDQVFLGKKGTVRIIYHR